MPELSEPTSWTAYEGQSIRWRSICMKEVVYSELPQHVAEVVEEVIQVGGCHAGAIERVERLDSETIEIIWFDDEGDDDHAPSHENYDPSPTKVPTSTVTAVQDVIQTLFGDHWRVQRKPDERRSSGSNPQRAIVRRASHQRFMYHDDSTQEYYANLYGRPDGVTDDVYQTGDLDRYPIPPTEIAGYPPDVYVYDSGTGTKHLIDGSHLRGQFVGKSTNTTCSLEVQPDDVVDGAGIVHYADILNDRYDSSDVTSGEDPHPSRELGDDFCDRCLHREYREYVHVDGYKPPSEDYDTLVRWWDGEEDYDER